MLATLKVGCRIAGLLLVVLGMAAVCGCREPGPRALLRGARLLEERQYDKALVELEKAVRVLPNHAQAWNHLGLAYHGSQQPQQALKAYNNALRLDHKLAAARFNLGCLLLEQNQTEAAVEELTSFTMVQPNSVQGFIQLGKAQLRAGKFGAAENSFRTALTLQPNHPEALNNLGVLQVQRQRPAEAMQSFNQVLTHHPQYGPAHYNAAVVSQQYLKNQSLALKRYQEYLALDPHPTNWAEVASVAQRLERNAQQLTLRPVTVDNKKALDLAAKKPQAPSPNRSPAQATTNEPTRTSSAEPAFVTTSPSTQALPAPAPGKVKESSKPPPEPAEVAVAATPPPPKPSPAKTAPSEPAPTPPPPIETVRAPEKESKPAQTAQLSVRKPGPSTAPPAKPVVPSTTAVSANRPPATADKQEPPVRPDVSLGSTKSDTQQPSQGMGNGQASPATTLVARARSEPLTAPLSPSAQPSYAPTPAGPGIARYQYTNPLAGQAGDRAKAEPLLREGLKWHRSGRQALGIERYQAAAEADPSFFDAYFNMGVAAFETADWQLCLASYEMAMALHPEALDAQFNFSVALQRANYPLDALRELKSLLQKNPKQARVHLAMGNLYDQVFRDPKRAREHYLQVLELDPRHPESQKIRFWLSTKR